MTATSKSRPLSHRPRLLWLLGVPSLFLALPVHSQSLGDLARQERERKQDQPAHSTHVYTNDDLKRPQILIPEDRERVQALKKKVDPLAKPAVETAKGEVDFSSLPLTIVRRHTLVAALVAPPPFVEPVVPLLVDAVAVPPSQSNPTPRSLAARTQTHRASSEQTARIPATLTSPVPVSIDSSSGNRSLSHASIADAGKTIRAEIAEGSRVQVQRGDTLWKLAKEYLGHGEDWPVLAANNPQMTEPARLRVGTWLRVPSNAANIQSTEQPSGQSTAHSSRSVRVERGDSLWKLTEAQFGDGRAWGCIAHANPQVQNANLILPGEILTIPESCAQSPVLQGRFLANSPESLPTHIAELAQQLR